MKKLHLAVVATSLLVMPVGTTFAQEATTDSGAAIEANPNAAIATNVALNKFFTVSLPQ